MNLSVKKGLLCLALLFWECLSYAQTHPFMIVKESDYTALRSRASSQPWSGMKSDAINAVNSLTYNTGLTDGEDKAKLMLDITASGALAYILDSANKASYKTKLVNAMGNWPDLFSTMNTSQHGQCVPLLAAFFNSVIALDIIYNDLTSAERSSLETKLGAVGTWAYGNATMWPEAGYSAACLWAIYTNNQSMIDTKKASYKSALLSKITGAGVYIDGAEYSIGRNMGGRCEVKTYIMDVLEFTGEDNTFYNDPKIKGLFEWQSSGATSPLGKPISFSDCSTNRDMYGDRLWSLHKFSVQAAKYASWLTNRLGLGRPEGHIMPYILADQALPAAERPRSRIFGPSGMASFWENSSSEMSLQGALWNPQINYSGSHSRKEVNAAVLNGYGEALLRNSGYCGYGTLSCYDWSYMHDNALSGNTVMVNGADHVSNAGAGIVEGFTSELFDYARGDSGSAISGARHYRNFCFVHPQDGRNGYFILFDEVDASAGNTANLVLHPASADYSITSASQEYKWNINRYSGGTRNLTIFLGNPPQTVAIRDGGLGDWEGSIMGKYLYATYSTDSGGNRNFVSVLFPHDATHAKAAMARVSGTGYTGASIDAGSSIIDTALESYGTGSFTYNGVSIQGKAAWYRKNAQDCLAFFVGNGKKFDMTGSFRYGFDSNLDVSVHLNDKLGRIYAKSDSEVSFYYPGLAGVLLDGLPVAVISSASGWVKVTVPDGSHTLSLVTDSGNTAPSITAHPSDKTVTQGYTAVFSVGAMGTLPLSYQWKKNSVNIPGATGASYTTPAAQLSDSGAKYKCTVTNAYGTATSNEATLTVDEEAGNIFSPVPYFGDADNYSPKTALRWQVALESGNTRYFLNTSAYSSDGDKPGEYSLINGRAYTDFTMTLKAKTAENVTSNTFTDYALIFGYQDANNYYYLLSNADTPSSQLFVVQNGERTALATSATALIPDTSWHDIELKRAGNSITVKLDGVIKIGPLTNSALGSGQIGVGSYNDSAYFDDINVSSGAVTDTTPPSAPGTVRDGTSITDINSTASRTQLSANWTAATDSQSGISGYQYAIGTAAGGTQTAGWVALGNVLAVTKTGLNLSVGTTYYFSVKAVNGAGLAGTASNSDGQVVLSTTVADTTPPSAPGMVRDGATAGTDASSTYSTTTLSANWTPSADADSGITGYQYAIGTIAGGTNITNWITIGNVLTVTKTGLSLTVGCTYYFSVKAVNGSILAGSATNSNGRYVVAVDPADTTPPSRVSYMNDGNEAGMDTDVTYLTDELSANWPAAADEESGVSGYLYAIGTTPGGTDITSWKDNGPYTEVTETGLTLVVGMTYYFSVKAVNGMGLQSAAASSNGQAVLPVPDTGFPVITNVQAINITANSVTITWDTDIPATSQVEFGFTPVYGILTIENGSLATAHSVTITGLTSGREYHYHVISRDLTGKGSASVDYGFTTLSSPEGVAGVNAYPNPYVLSRPGGMKFKVSASAGGEVKIYTLSGKLVRKLSGTNEIVWDGKNEEGQKVARGVYIYKIVETGGDTKTGKLAVVR